MKKAILLVAIGFSIIVGYTQEKTNHITYYDYFKTIVKTRYQTIGNNVLHGPRTRCSLQLHRTIN